MSSRKKVSIFGVTGSIGKSAADVILNAPERFEVHTVTAAKNVAALADAAIRLNARQAVIAHEEYREPLIAALSGTGIRVRAGRRDLIEAAVEPVDVMLAAIIGFDGLRPILAALESGINVAIANKEPLVAAGALVKETARKSGAKLLPVDSEHNAIFQVLEEKNTANIEKIFLTASGGPFLNWTKDQMEQASPEEAIAHPNWSMGPKISVDSATMMNKALEIIEASVLFDFKPAQIEVLIHPQSVVHSLVAYTDGSVLAQLGESDMRIPVAHALAWPQRLDKGGRRLDLTAIGSLTFQSPDFEKFPALRYAYECLERGESACIALNAANEVAVSAFLNNRIGFTDIMACIANALSDTRCNPEAKGPKTVEEIEKLDQTVRALTEEYIESLLTQVQHRKTVNHS
ncbi:MAG: 1-deoxy-D-xylulose-5-phosphate reductoisomerase [Alphaproteobacteria bacterium]|nr:1-deoxy-D-xylulose-5-phosphate reductoisomerase [Alphaproteobacteria bacterium]